MADTRDLKSLAFKACQFESDQRHQFFPINTSGLQGLTHDNKT